MMWGLNKQLELEFIFLCLRVRDSSLSLSHYISTLVILGPTKGVLRNAGEQEKTLLILLIWKKKFHSFKNVYVNSINRFRPMLYVPQYLWFMHYFHCLQILTAKGVVPNVVKVLEHQQIKFVTFCSNNNLLF